MILQALCPLVFLLACSTSNASVLQTGRVQVLRRNAPGHRLRLLRQVLPGRQGERRLAAIAVKIVRAAAKGTAKHIAALRASEKDRKRLECLRSCSELYSDAVDEIGTAATGIASGTAGGREDAITALSAVVDAPTTCEEGFQELQAPSPLAAEDAEFGREASVALTVTAAL